MQGCDGAVTGGRQHPSVPCQQYRPCYWVSECVDLYSVYSLQACSFSALTLLVWAAGRASGL